MSPSNFDKLRSAMVKHQIAGRGIASHQVLQAMLAVPREAFLPQGQRQLAYEDHPLPIDQGQTMSQPYIVALMAEAMELQGGEQVLEIGTGSGYGAAVLSQIAKQVYSVELLAQLATQAVATLAELGYHRVEVRQGDGTLGWPEHAPYDAIAVTAGGPSVPEALKAQLKIDGRLVIPVGPDRHFQTLLRVTRVSEHRYTRQTLASVRFVPLLGAQGWAG